MCSRMRRLKCACRLEFVGQGTPSNSWLEKSRQTPALNGEGRERRLIDSATHLHSGLATLAACSSKKKKGGGRCRSRKKQEDKIETMRGVCVCVLVGWGGGGGEADSDSKFDDYVFEEVRKVVKEENQACWKMCQAEETKQRHKERRVWQEEHMTGEEERSSEGHDSGKTEMTCRRASEDTYGWSQ